MSQGQAPLSRQRLAQYFFFGVFLTVLYQLLKLFSPFAMAVFGAAIVALLVHPLHVRVSRRLGGAQAAAAVTTALAVLLVVLPSLLLSWAFLKDAERLYPIALSWFEQLRRFQSGQSAWAGSGLLEAAGRLLGLGHVELEEFLLKNFAELRGSAMTLAAAVLTNTLFTLFNLGLLAFTLFFFLRDGEGILDWLVRLVPMAQGHKEAILSRLRDTLIGLVRGVFGLAVAQGVLSGLGFALIGVPLPALLGMLTTLLSPIPFLGALGVLAPVALAMSFAGSTAAALAAAAWALGVAILVERVLRPIVVAPENEIPVLPLFFGLLGGIRVYGPSGALLGPVVIALTLAFLNVYRQEYRWLLEPEEG